MIGHPWAHRRQNAACHLTLAALLLAHLTARADDATPVEQGQRVFSAGHSFHVFVPGLLNEIARSAGVKDHVFAGLQPIGGSRVIQHWDVADDKNLVKQALKAKKVDVLTLSPIYLPDEGIANFTKLAVEHNPDIRITIQEFWLPYDVFDPKFLQKRPDPVDRNAQTGETLRKMHEGYFKSIDEHVEALNKEQGRQVLFVVPAGQAVIALREAITAGKAPGIAMQKQLFTDPLGHAGPAIQALVAYCHYAVIYRKNPEGLPTLSILKKQPHGDELNALLQKLAWEAVVAHPLSGVKEAEKANP